MALSAFLSDGPNSTLCGCTNAKLGEEDEEKEGDMASLRRFIQLRHHFSSTSPSLRKHHSKIHLPATPSLSSVLRSIYRENDPDNLTTLLHHSSITTTPGLIRAAHPVLVAALRRLVSTGRSSTVVDFLETQKQSSPQIVRESFASGVISLYGKARMADKASDTFLDLPFLGCPRTSMSFRALVCALVDAGSVNSAENWIRSVEKDYPEIVPGDVCYNAVIHGFFLIGDVEKAMGILGLMLKRGLNPNLVTHNTLLNGFCRNSRFNLADKWWIEMGPNKNIKSYNARLRGLVSQRKTAEAVKLFRDLEINNDGTLKPDGYTFTALIVGHCQDGDIMEAKKMFDEMRRRRCHPNRLTFEALVPRLCEAGDIELALVLCEESLAQKLKLSEEVIQAMVDALAENSRVEDAQKLFELGWSSRSYDEKTLKMPCNC